MEKEEKIKKDSILIFCGISDRVKRKNVEGWEKGAVMDIKNLVTFIHVAELRSFTKAGDKLGYSQSTVSFQIRQLENELGVP